MAESKKPKPGEGAPDSKDAPKGAPKGASKDAPKAPKKSEKPAAKTAKTAGKDSAAKETAHTARGVAKEDRKFVSASTGKTVKHPEMGHAAHSQGADLEQAHADRKAQAGPFRIAAAVLWVAGIVCEVLAFVFLKGNKSTPWVITPLVIDLVLVVVGSQMWKKANHIDPPAKSEGVLYWLKTELGMIVAVVAFCPIIVLLLLDKDADKKTKGLATVVAAVALVIAGASGFDYHPATQEQLDAATDQAALLADGGECYWTASGTVYHFNPDCSHLNHSAEIVEGTVQEAFDAGKTRGCKDCTEAEGDDVIDEKKQDTEILELAQKNQDENDLDTAESEDPDDSADSDDTDDSDSNADSADDEDLDEAA